MAFKRISLDDKKKGLGADAFFKNTKDFLVDEDKKDNTKKDSPIRIIDLDENLNSNGQLNNDTSTSENIIKDNDIINSNANITDDSKINDVINDSNTTTDNIDFDDIINATDNDINNANNDDVIKNIRKIIKKRVKYTDVHERRTYYLDKDVVKKLDKLSTKYDLDKSYLVNEALKLFFKVLENKNKS
ncbi:hypothetical protein PQV03_14180 [Thermoanaerobacterium thermosaccharolyticum]|uniref:hypothetical protein n=1 Tax=Thermoanaerobacterium thermosaccharolyticum TaxID=1517 RepID=UPI003D281422